jgi:hypothetical protein
MANNFLVRTDCEVRMHCNNSKLSQVPEMHEQMCVSPARAGFLVDKVRDAEGDAGQVTGYPPLLNGR